MEGSRNSHDLSSPGVWGRKPPCNHFLGGGLFLSSPLPSHPTGRSTSDLPQAILNTFETSKNIPERKKKS